MSIKKFSMLLLSTISLAALLNGCGSSSKETGISANDVPRVGDTACVQCHSAVTEPLTGESIIVQYKLTSPHNTPDLGCESCHGGGAQHNGVGPIPYPKPDANRCATCHNGVIAKLTNANTAFATSNHATGTPSHTSGVCIRCHTHEGAVLSNGTGFTGDSTVIGSATLAPPAWTGGLTGIQCDTCHQHGGGLRGIKAIDTTGKVVAWNPGKSSDGRTNQFNLCTSCHTMYNYNGNQLLAGGLTYNGIATGTVGFHSTSWYRIIATTHFDNYSTGPQAGTTAAGTNVKVEGYALRKNGANPCFDCHGHEAKAGTRYGQTTTPTTHTDWAQSAHAGGLLTAKYNAVGASSGATAVTAAMNAYVDDTTAIGWTHYNWDASSRAACQRCHTATGAENFMKNPSGYNAANNNFSHLDRWTATNGSKQNELLYCWGCHSNAGTGALHNPGARVETYAVSTTGDTPVTVAYPDIAGSNVCMTCHVGREVGDTIKNDGDADGVRSFVNSHYLTAGATLFGKSGYTYTGLNYANPTYFAHDKIGSTAAAGTGSNGPCAGCHMTSPNKHKFTNVTKTAGVISAITSSACITCHDGSHGTALAANDAAAATFLATEEEEYKASLEALKAVLASKGMHFFEAYPYFFAGAGGTGGAFTNWAGVYGFASWKDTMGAAYNANLLIHDPGGYAHNRIYAKRLIWDSIDFLDDGILNNSVTTVAAPGISAIDAQVTALRISAAVATNAKTYLGATRP